MSLRAFALSRRALQESSRSKVPISLRGLVILALFFTVFAAQESAARGLSSGADLLGMIAWTDWVLINLLGVTAFASVITQEKEAMSLGLLRLAGFSPASLLLGKSVGLLLQALFLLIVQVPFCMLAITLGGVTLAQVLTIYGVLLSYLMLVYSASMLCSVVMPRNRSASIMATILLLTYHILPPISLAILAEQRATWVGGALTGWLTSWQSSTAMYGLAESSMSVGGAGLDVQSHIYSGLLLSLIFFCAAWSLFGVCTRNEVVSAPSRRRNLLGLFGRNRRGSLRVWTNNPFLWKDYQFTAGGWTTTITRCLWYLAFFVLISLIDPYRNLRDLGEWIMGTMCFVIVLEIGMQLGRVFQQEIKQKTLASLFTSPHPLPFIALSKIAGTLWIAVPALLFFFVGALLDPQEVSSFIRRDLDEPGFWMFIMIIITGFHLTVYYSLRFPRGAFALAVATMFLVTTFTVMLLAGVLGIGNTFNEDCLALFFALVLLAACCLLWTAIGARLKVLIAED